MQRPTIGNALLLILGLELPATGAGTLVGLVPRLAELTAALGLVQDADGLVWTGSGTESYGSASNARAPNQPPSSHADGGRHATLYFADAFVRSDERRGRFSGRPGRLSPVSQWTPSEARFADAVVAVHAVRAHGPVLAGVSHALVSVCAGDAKAAGTVLVEPVRC